MSVYQIVTDEDQVLREKAKEIKEINNNIHKLLDNMKDTMRAAQGAGLAAPQIGISKRAIVVDVYDEELELINPVLLSGEGEQTDYEGCLSVPGFTGEVTRYNIVKVTGLNRNGEKVEYVGEGLMARALQHEIDHLDGILYIDKAKNIRRVE